MRDLVKMPIRSSVNVSARYIKEDIFRHDLSCKTINSIAKTEEEKLRVAKQININEKDKRRRERCRKLK